MTICYWLGSQLQYVTDWSHDYNMSLIGIPITICHWMGSWLQYVTDWDHDNNMSLFGIMITMSLKEISQGHWWPIQSQWLKHLIIKPYPKLRLITRWNWFRYPKLKVTNKDSLRSRSLGYLKVSANIFRFLCPLPWFTYVSWWSHSAGCCWLPLNSSRIFHPGFHGCQSCDSFLRPRLLCKL